MFSEKYLANKKALIITLDNVLYPEKDYLLQVYYLFSEFMAYTEQFDAKLMLEFMKIEFGKNGAHGIYQRTAEQFGFADQYEHNFNLLHETARLPLKLLMYQNVLDLLQQVAAQRKKMILLVDGSPAIAINKIKQLEWHGLDQILEVYFTAEYNGVADDTLLAAMASKNIEPQEVSVILSENHLNNNFVNLEVDCFSVTEIL